MTYCVGIFLDNGLVFASDTRTNAGVDNISTFRKLTVLEQPGDRVMVLLSAGNLATTQEVANHLNRNLGQEDSGFDLLSMPDMFSAAKMVGTLLREVLAENAEHVKSQNGDPVAEFIFGGQIKGGQQRLFQIYSAGNFIEASRETPFFQIGETKYGKPILDRVVKFQLSLEVAAKAALLSFDSTLRSNLSVGLPFDLVLYRKDSLAAGDLIEIREDDAYFTSLREAYGDGIKALFHDLDDLPAGPPRQ